MWAPFGVEAGTEQRVLCREASQCGDRWGMPLTVFFSADGLDRTELLPLSPLTPTMEEEPLVIFLSGDEDTEKAEEKKKSKELKSLWKKAIHQQILLLRMEKENQKLEG